MNLNSSSNKNFPSKRFSWFVGIFLLCAFVGFVDASYLSINEIRGAALPCSITHGCAAVTASAYSKILGIPVAFLGALYYLTVFLTTIAYCDTKNIRILKYATYFTALGFIMSGWFLYVQGAILHAWCQYCLASAGSSTLLFILGVVIRKNLSANSNINSNAFVATSDEVSRNQG